ncbi:MAG: NUDIX hydrolase [Candidatus Dormibacteria bacterium]
MTAEPAVPRDAATAALIRDGDRPDGPPEVLLLERADRAHFAPRALVFPGGSLDPGDRDPRWGEFWDPVESGRPDRRAGLEFRVGAMRETFEECGVLLGSFVGGAARLEEERARWRRGGGEGFLDLCRRLGLRPALESLVFVARWVTPEGFSRRFDARFFLAPLPPGQEPRADPLGESGSWRWADPAEALHRGRQGEWQLLPPTRAVLQLLAAGRGVEGTLAAARARRVVTRRPRLEEVTARRYPGLDRSRLEAP